MNPIENIIIKRGVVNLKEFGYPGVDEANIITDQVYSSIFIGMLESNLGGGHDEVIMALINRIKEARGDSLK